MEHNLNLKPSVEIYADGACSGNPGVGGYGAIVRSGGKDTEITGCEELTTNNRMEMLAVISALEALTAPARVRVVSDSNYVVKGMTEWKDAWIRRGWRNSQNKDVLNRDLWERLIGAAAVHEVAWEWIRGHNGHPENERCDLLARCAIKECRRKMQEKAARRI